MSARLFTSQLALPMHANLVDDDLDYVAAAAARACWPTRAVRA